MKGRRGSAKIVSLQIKKKSSYGLCTFGRVINTEGKLYGKINRKVPVIQFARFKDRGCVPTDRSDRADSFRVRE